MTQATIHMILQHRGWLALLGPLIDVASHAHRPLQLVLPLNSPCSLEIDCNAMNCESAVAINSGIEHALYGQNALILLIEPACQFGRILQQHLRDNWVVTLPSGSVSLKPGDVA